MLAPIGPWSAVEPVEYVYCNACGHRNPPQSVFCSACGTVLDAPTHRTIVLPKTDPLQDAPGSADNAVIGAREVAPGEVMLVVRQGDVMGTRFALTGDQVAVGRIPDNDIVLDDVTVSRRHAVLVNESGKWMVRDLRSLNGTYLNHVRVDEAVINHGDELQVGKYRLVAFFG
jgi:hypothetical protein